MTFRVDMNKATQYDDLAAQTDREFGLPEGLSKLVMMIENRNDPKNRVSPKGASGVMQIMPANYKALGVTDPNDPSQSFKAAGQLLSDALKRYDGNVGAALADYNGGPKVAQQYLDGAKLNPETTDYLRYAEPHFSFAKPSTWGRNMMNSAETQLEGMVPSDLGYKTETQEFYTGLEDSMDKDLQESAKYSDYNAWDAFKYGYADTLTSAISHVMTRDEDENFSVGAEQFEQIRQTYPQGLNKAQTDRLYNSRSQSDWEYNWQKTADEADLMRRVSEQTDLGKAGATAAIISGGLFDPAALPLSTFGAVGKVVRGASLGAKVARGAAEAAVVTGALSPIIQTADKGGWSGEDVVMHMGTAAMFGASISGFSALGKHGKAFADETIAATENRMNGAPEYQPTPKMEDSIPEPINFAGANQVSEGAAGEIIGVGPTEVMRAAHAYDESVSPAMQAVQNRRQKFYDNALRTKLAGWADSEGVKLARSKSKTARFVQAMWSGNAAGLGKQEARTAAVMKEQLVEQMQWETIPELKQLFAESLTPAQVLDYMGGGAKDAQAAFSKAVQMERYKHRVYRRENGGDSKGYQSDAPANVQRAAQKLDELYAKTKKLHMDHGTEHAETLAKEDSVGYIEQRPDFNKLVTTTNEHRKAFLDMVKDDYKAEAQAKVNAFRENRAEWLEAAYKRAESDMEAPWVNEFLANPDLYFDKQVSNLSKKIGKEMEKRASHWWENALRDPETRYQNSEASLMTMAREMADEWFTGKEVDADLVKAFQDSLTKKWADTSRRELNMLNSRVVNGETVHLLDMFQHDVFGASMRNISDTAGRVSLAKMGWKREQDIADTLDAMRHDGATPEEIKAAKHISDLLLNRAGGLDNSPLVQGLSNMVYANMMGKLPASLLADIPTIIGNLGVKGMTEALGNMAKHAVDGSLFVKNGRPTPLGRDLGAYLNGLTGADHLLWVPQQVNADGLAMEVGSGLLRRSAAAARFTSTVSGTNAISRMIGSAVTKTTVDRLHKALRTGKGITANRLEDVGLNPEVMKRVKEQFDLHSTKEDFGLDKWSAREREEFVSAAHKFANQNRIDRAYAGETPQWSRDNILGYLYSKFRVIGIRAQEKVLARNLTMMDSNTVAMMTAGLAFATFLSYARIHLDAATSKDGRKVLEERLTPMGLANQTLKMSSIMGLGSEFGNVIEMMTGGGIQGGSSVPLMGPVDNVTKAVQATGAAVAGEGKASAAGEAWFKTLPGSNSYLLMGIKEAIKD